MLYLSKATLNSYLYINKLVLLSPSALVYITTPTTQGADLMHHLIQLILQNLTFFALHLKNLTSFPKPLSAKRETELLQKMKHQGNSEARTELIEHNLRLVSHIIKKYYSNYDEQEDLISIGTIGLIKAIDSFDADKGARLATYAARCIENAILSLRRTNMVMISH